MVIGDCWVASAERWQYTDNTHRVDYKHEQMRIKK